MDAEVLVQALTGTLDPQGREQAEAVLQKVRIVTINQEILVFLSSSCTSCPSSRRVYYR